MRSYLVVLALAAVLIFAGGCQQMNDWRKVNPDIASVSLDPNSSTLRIVVDRSDATLVNLFVYGFNNDGGKRTFDWQYSPGGVLSNHGQTIFTLIIEGSGGTAIEYGHEYHAVIGVSAPVFDYNKGDGSLVTGYGGGEYTLITPARGRGAVTTAPAVAPATPVLSRKQVEDLCLQLLPDFQAQHPGWVQPVQPAPVVIPDPAPVSPVPPAQPAPPSSAP